MTQPLSDYLKKSYPRTQQTGIVQLAAEENETATGMISGERTVSGSTTIPEADDNVLDFAHEAGLYTEADEENPHELNMAQEIEEAEIAFRDEAPE